jgi:hypothetical protein
MGIWNKSTIALGVAALMSSSVWAQDKPFAGVELKMLFSANYLQADRLPLA